MENIRYNRNHIYISEEQQNLIKGYKIVLAGAGLGSNIAECALRLGFENITILDYDSVEESNLNRQNYTHKDIGNSKVSSLLKRLNEINPHARIIEENVCLGKKNIEKYIKDKHVAINTLDFTSEAPFIFDDMCMSKDIKVIHPFNLGWGCIIFVLCNKSEKPILNKTESPEIQIVNDFIKNKTIVFQHG